MTDSDHAPQYAQDRPEAIIGGYRPQVGRHTDEPPLSVPRQPSSVQPPQLAGMEDRIDRIERAVLQLQRAVIRMQEQALGS